MIVFTICIIATYSIVTIYEIAIIAKLQRYKKCRSGEMMNSFIIEIQ